MAAQKIAPPPKRAPGSKTSERRSQPASSPGVSKWMWLGAGAVGVAVVVVLLVATGSHGGRGGSSTAPTNGAYVGGGLHSLMVNPSDSHEVFVGGHQSAAVSHDGGRSFQQIAGLQNVDAMSWSIAPNGRTQVVSGHYGLRTSADGGSQWTDRTSSLPGSDVHAVGLDPSTPTHLVADLVGRGIFTSSDVGQTWRMVGGANLSLMGPILVGPGGKDLIANDMMSGLVESKDGGAHWSVLSQGCKRPGWPAILVTPSTCSWRATAWGRAATAVRAGSHSQMARTTPPR